MADPKINLKWRCSYSTYLYDTPDGDLGLGEYAEDPDGEHYCIRTDSKKRWNTRKVERVGFNTMGMVKVGIVPDVWAVYDEFRLPSGKIIRIRGDEVAYFRRRDVADEPQPKKEVDVGEITLLEQD